MILVEVPYCFNNINSIYKLKIVDENNNTIDYYIYSTNKFKITMNSIKYFKIKDSINPNE
jgi:hypothetical protein